MCGRLVAEAVDVGDEGGLGRANAMISPQAIRPPAAATLDLPLNSSMAPEIKSIPFGATHDQIFKFGTATIFGYPRYMYDTTPFCLLDGNQP
jgi:hypothetical protein